MALLQEWDMLMTVLGLLLATLLMASLVHRYQLHMADVQARVRRLSAGAIQIEQAFAELRAVPLSRELRVTLRGDVLTRYQRIRQLYRRYPGLPERLRAAESALHSEGAPSGRGVGPIEDDEAFRRIIVSLDRLLDAVAPGGMLRGVPEDVRAIFRRELGERRAEAMSRFHMVKAKRLENAGSMTRARSHLTTLLHVLRQRGPSTDFVRELHAEAEAALSALGSRPPNDQDTDQAPAPNSVLMRRLAG